MIIKKIFIIIFFFILPVSVYSQLIERDLVLQTGYSTGVFTNQSMITEDGFSVPSLFGNFNSNNGLYLALTLKLNDYFSAGFGYNYSISGNWRSGDYQTYSEASVEQQFFKPTVFIHPEFRDEGLLNRIKPYAFFSPSFCISNFRFPENLYDVFSDHLIRNTNYNYTFTGLSTGFGAEVFLNQYFGFFLQFGGNFYRTESSHFLNSSFSSIILQTGISLQIKKSKNIYY
ncbi:MAG: hypothetical protein ACOC4B_01025 [Bacteroidota bacterium]